MDTYTCNSLEDLITAFRQARHDWEVAPWTRGQAVDENWKLVPSVWREFGNRPLAEMNSFSGFRNRAVGMRADCPAHEDCLGWLMLMQHFSLATRLLDWTQSLAVAGFFAVFDEELQDDDGVVWLLNPLMMNYHMGERNPPSVALINDQSVIDLASRAAKGENFVDHAVAIYSPHHNERIIRQHGSFTIHGSPLPIEEHAGASDFLVKAVIPRQSKLAIADSLGCLGTSRTSLFPDIETLGKVITASIKEGVRLGHWGEEVYP